ncbi:MAG: ATP-binding cassette domain-containing protein [Desulfobacterota bacterium]|nr:ATP-binding cassette domain-containing protein [Thermodesulfobacteriota bacterium]
MLRLIHLPTFWTIVIDFVIWFIIHIGVVALMVRVPARHFNPKGWLYRGRSWEKGGDLYQDVFKVKKWKQHLPDGASFLGRFGFPKKQLNGKDQSYFEAFLVETCRAEATHWIFILFAPLFFLWNPTWVGWVMIFYALAENLPFIIAQRYNRFRFGRLLTPERGKGSSTTKNHPILLVKDLWKRFGKVDAVQGLTFEIRRGECFGLLGPNGAGKTTTIGLLAGLIPPDRGRILIDGIDLLSNPLEAKTKLGLVPQNLALYPSLTARDNLIFFGRLYGLKGRHLEERVAHALTFVSLWDRAGQPVGTFSHGMKRRLNIAAGLLHEPDLLILDEPTVGVDPQSRMAILESLRSLNQAGMSLLYTTHYIEEAHRLCERIAILDWGKVIALGPPAQLIREFGRGMIRLELNGEADDPLIEKMRRVGSVTIVDPQKRVFFIETAHLEQASRALLDFVGSEEGKLKTLHLSEPNLETVFIHLTGRTLRDG